MKKSILVCLAIGLVLSFGTIASAVITPGQGIVGSLHDLSNTGAGGIAIGSTETKICVFCHTPHFAAKSGDTGMSGIAYNPLWNHTMSTFATYTMYSNGTEVPNMQNAQLNETSTGPGSVSKLCLSCHDGSVAVNSYGTYQSNPTKVTGSTFMPTSFKVGAGGDLSNHHPIGFVYTDALALDDELFDVTSSLKGGTGLTIGDVLWNNKVECVSCHSVHNKKNEGYKFLWVNDDLGSALCLSCHNK